MFLEALTASHLFLASAQAVQAPKWCRPTGAAPISLSLSYAPIRYDYSKSTDQLGRFDIDTINPYGDHAHTIVGGLTQAMVKVEHQMQMGGVRYGRQSCLWVEKVSVILRLEPVVYVASNYPRASCRFKSILEHEAKHVKVDQQLAQRYKAVYEQAILDAINKYRIIGPFSMGEEKVVQKDLAAYVQKVIGGVTDQFQHERDRWQQAVDTREEYDRVAALCPRERY